MKRLGLAVLVLGLLFLSAFTPALAADGWNLEQDFKIRPNQANPNPDLYGNPVWSFYAADPMGTRFAYSQMPNYFATVNRFPKCEEWMRPDYSDPTNMCFGPCVAINRTGHAVTVNSSPISWPAEWVVLHPGPTASAAVGWTAPFNGTYQFSALFKAMDHWGGDGVDWAVERGMGDQSYQTLAFGHIVYQAGTGGQATFFHPGLALQAGDTLFFRVGPGGTFTFDTTHVAVTVTQLDTTPPTVPGNLFATPGPGGVMLGWNVSTDDTGVASYLLYRNTVAYASIPAQNGTLGHISYQDTQVAEGTTYTYAVAARDLAGNLSAQTPPVTVTTLTSVHVDAIAMASATNKKTRTETLSTTVTVGNKSGLPVAGVTVNGALALPGTGGTVYLSGITGANGTVVLPYSVAGKALPRGTYTFTVSNLTKSGVFYQPAGNTVTSKSFIKR